MQEEEPDLVALLDAWSEAIVSNDAEAIGSYMAEEWVIVSETGISSREEFLALVRSGRLTHSAMRRLGEARVRRYGSTATITARVVNTAHYEGERFEADEWTTDVLALREDRWLCVLSQISSAAPID
jgi:ketosteroid isomerase-like protein